MTLALIAITLIYLLLIGRFIFGFDKVKTLELHDLEPVTTFSIIISFRNEAENLPGLLQSLSELNYPSTLFEIILIDDESTDESVSIIEGFGIELKHIKNIRTTASPKKDAIVTAIETTKHDWLLTTDADCTFNSDWLRVLDNFIQQNQPKMVVGPVAYQTDNTFLQRFQYLDFMSLTGATIGGFGIGKPFLCNGANLSYTKNMFKELKGFEGNADIASGDDIFMMEKIHKSYPDDIAYLKHENAIVITKPQPTISQLISQRKRWAAKTSSYTIIFGKLVGAVVLLMNFSLLSAAFLSIFGVFTIKTVGYVFLIKFCIDLWLILKAAQFLKATNQLKSYALSSLIYPIFNVYVAITSWYSGYTWKGRKFKK